jgi:hypothetical protein
MTGWLITVHRIEDGVAVARGREFVKDEVDRETRGVVMILVLNRLLVDVMRKARHVLVGEE